MRHRCGLLGNGDVRQLRLHDASGLCGWVHARQCDEHCGRHGQPHDVRCLRVRLLQDGCGQRSVRELRCHMLRLELCVDSLHDDDQPRLRCVRIGVFE